MWSGFRPVLTHGWTTRQISLPATIRWWRRYSTPGTMGQKTGSTGDPPFYGRPISLAPVSTPGRVTEKPYRELRFKLHQNDQATLHRILVEIHQSRLIALIADLVEPIPVLLVGVAVDELIVKFGSWVWHKASHCETEKNETQA